jgi:hypothetical protein
MKARISARTLAETPVLGNGRIAASPNERVKMAFALTTKPPPPISRQNLGLHAALHKPKYRSIFRCLDGFSGWCRVGLARMNPVMLDQTGLWRGGAVEG